MDQFVEVVRHLSLEGVHHEVHPFLHHLHLYNHVWRCHVYVLSLLSAQGIVALRSFSIPPISGVLGAIILLFFFLIMGPNVPLVQLFFQVVILLSKAFHSCR